MTLPQYEPPTRAARRAAQRRKRRLARVKWTGAGLALLATAALAFAVYLAMSDPEPPSSQGAPPGRTQSTVLLQVRGLDGQGVANALLAFDPATRAGAGVLLPPQVLVTVPGTGPGPLGRTLVDAKPDATRAAVSDLIGVTVDDGWVVSLPAFVTLVDVLGGITVDVDAQVSQGQAVLLNPGTQRLDGVRAAAFLTYLGPGEQEQTRLARVQEVLDGLLDVMPPTPAELTSRLQALGDGSVSTQPVPRLAAFLLGIADSDEQAQLQYDVLPVIPIDAGGGVSVFRIDSDKVRTLVDRLFPSSVPAGVRERGNRVLVLNGVGTPGLGDVVRRRIVPAGFVFVGSRNAPSFGAETTQVLVADSSAEARALGERLAKVLGVPLTSIATQPLGTVADVVVVIGADFRA